MPGLYLHIPFCLRKCAYCDFYSLPGRSPDIDLYIEALLREAEKQRGLAFDTLYVGGGTPSLLGPDGLCNLMMGLRRVFDLSRLGEATLEANPESTSVRLLQAAREMGINRLSLGVQSLSDSELAAVGRVHDSRQAVEALELAGREGFTNLSADVILGLPGQDWPALMVTLEALIGLDILHLSAYCLSLEPHTPLAENPPPALSGPDEQADLYEQAAGLLERRGFLHYEISNFSLPGFECEHNLNYWRGGEYLGLGPGAASHWRGRRCKNRADLDSYLKDPGGQLEEVEDLKPAAKAAEEAILRLRLLREGLDAGQLGRKFGKRNLAGLLGRLGKLAAGGRLKREGSCFFLPESQALISNPILAELLPD